MSFPLSRAYETFTGNHLIVVCSSSDLLVSLDKAQGLTAQYIILDPSPYNSSLKFRFFPPLRGEKVGFWFLRDKINWFLTHMCGSAVLYASWLFLTLRSLWGTINYSRRFCVPHIQRRNADPMADISPSILSGSTPFHLLLLYKPLKDSPFPLFFTNLELQRTPAPSLHKTHQTLEFP